MKKLIGICAVLWLACLVPMLGAQEPELRLERPFVGMLRQGDVMIPDTSLRRPTDWGRGAHTNHVILAPDSALALPSASPTSLPWGENPASIRSVYQLPSTGGAGTIAIVDAYDDPHASQDLAVFSNMFGLPACTTANGCFRKVYAKGVAPRVDCGWAQEISLDIEWAHAMAPNAKIVLVEAASSGLTDLLQAVDVANSIVSRSGQGFGEISMSWGRVPERGEL